MQFYAEPTQTSCIMYQCFSFTSLTKRFIAPFKRAMLLITATLAIVPAHGFASPSVTVSPTSLNWGSVSVGSKSAPKSVALTGAPNAPTTISSITISGANAQDFFIYSKTCGDVLPAGQQCSVSVVFAPTDAGTRTGTLVFSDSADNSPQTVTLSGTGSGSAVTLSPANLSFGSVTVGQQSSGQTATLKNGTNASITISGASITGTNASDFLISFNNCGNSLGAGASCTITVAFKPTMGGSRAARLSISDSANNSPQTAALSGTGTVTGSVTLTPNSLTFASTKVGYTSAAQTTVLSNAGSTSITISSIGVNGTNASDFAVNSKTCGNSLGAGASCNISVVFRPSAGGSRTAILTVYDTDRSSPQTAALSGTAQVVNVTLSQDRFTWGPTKLGVTSSAQTTTLTNTGSSTVTFSNISLTSTNASEFSISANNCGTSLAPGAKCDVSVTFKPGAVGTRVALLTVADDASNAPQIVSVSGTGGTLSLRSASVTADFGSRLGNQVSIPSTIFGTQYLESLPDAASRNMVVQAGLRTSRLHGNIVQVYATTTPDWSKIDGSIRALQAAGVHPIVELDGTPPWLVPLDPLCPGTPQVNVPSDLNKWGQLAASFVAHFDGTFPGVVQDYEIWNEPNTGALCSNDRTSDYLSIYAAAAPLMKQQAAADKVSIRVGGPASAGVAMGSLLTDPRTAPYVDFYSYHIYLGGPGEIINGMTWDGAGGTPSLLALILNPNSGEQARYLQALHLVKGAKTPLGPKTPIYFDEYNDDWAFRKDCCRNNPTYSPLFNSLVVAQIFNSVYAGAANQVPSRMIYFAAANRPFCLVAVINSQMDCTLATSSSFAGAYPQLYTYKLFASPDYLGLVEGGHMATSITLSSGAQQSGLIATGFYTGTNNGIVIINPTASSFSGATVQASNPGFVSPAARLYTLNAANGTISSWPAALFATANGFQSTFDIPAHSVVAFSLR